MNLGQDETSLTLESEKVPIRHAISGNLTQNDYWVHANMAAILVAGKDSNPNTAPDTIIHHFFGFVSS
jgi:hypothetical protein